MIFRITGCTCVSGTSAFQLVKDSRFSLIARGFNVVIPQQCFQKTTPNVGLGWELSTCQSTRHYTMKTLDIRGIFLTLWERSQLNVCYWSHIFASVGGNRLTSFSLTESLSLLFSLHCNSCPKLLVTFYRNSD